MYVYHADSMNTYNVYVSAERSECVGRNMSFRRLTSYNLIQFARKSLKVQMEFNSITQVNHGWMSYMFAFDT